MKRALIAIGLATTLATPLAATQADAPPEISFRYCSALSTSPRGTGLIVTMPFEPRERDVALLRRSFIAFLRYGIAPYGNSWIFDEDNVSCATAATRGEAERRRAYLIGRYTAEGRKIFAVPFSG
ncbi:hypothetical protein ABS767_02670 [Sphingomonas sp. ST-64]|uniref:Uncharacterized protein n=1 Tax=Sphingomonas plantiphila TaxID=3163295 RepID=A0ABW8YHW0_9SPHN